MRGRHVASIECVNGENARHVGGEQLVKALKNDRICAVGIGCDACGNEADEHEQTKQQSGYTFSKIHRDRSPFFCQYIIPNKSLRRNAFYKNQPFGQ